MQRNYTNKVNSGAIEIGSSKLPKRVTSYSPMLPNMPKLFKQLLDNLKLLIEEKHLILGSNAHN